MKRGDYGFRPSAAPLCAKSAEAAGNTQNLIRKHNAFHGDFPIRANLQFERSAFRSAVFRLVSGSSSSGVKWFFLEIASVRRG
jgi:hypothetical protein